MGGRFLMTNRAKKISGVKLLVVLVAIFSLVLVAGSSAVQGALYNVDFEQLGSQGTYKTTMAGAGPGGGPGAAGDVWNVFEISEGGTSAPVGMSLLDSGGGAGSVNFEFTSTDAGVLAAYGHAPTAIDDLTAEYLFLGDQNGTYEANWQITGLTGGTAYSMYLYTGGYDAVNGGHNADYNLDLDGDGALDGLAAIVGNTNAPTVVSNIVADGSGTIVGQFLHNGVGESEIGGFQLSSGAPPAPVVDSRLAYNVDFEQLASQGTYKAQMVGAGPAGGAGKDGDVWNVFEISADADGTAAPVGQALVDNSGASSSVNFTFTSTDAGTLGAYGHSPTAIDDLTAEYLFLGPQNGANEANWEVTGLAPGGTYEMYLYTGGYDAVNGGHNADYNLDLDGDGVLDGVGAIVGNTNAPTIVQTVADGSGTIVGQFLHNGVGESEVGGFQLVAVIPEPSSVLLLMAGIVGLFACRSAAGRR